MGMNQEQKDLRTGLNAHITLPDCVEERIQEAYQSIRKNQEASGRNEVVVVKKRNMNKWVVVAAAVVLTCTATFGVWAAVTGYFSKEVEEDKKAVTYKFEVNYELVPGEFEVEPSYLPSGYVKREGENMIWAKDNEGQKISVFSVYNTTDLERMNNEIILEGLKGAPNIEKTTLAGMEAHVIIYQEGEKYRWSNDIYLFNPQEGYIIDIIGDYNVPLDELKRFADGLKITRVSDAEFETEEQKAARIQEAEEWEREIQKIDQRMKEQSAVGIPKDEIVALGESAEAEWLLESGEYYRKEEFTITDVQYADSISDYDTRGFFDYSELEPWLNEDGTLKPYIRVHEDAENNIVAEEQVNQQFLVVKAKVKKCELNESNETDKQYSKDTPIGARLERLVEREDGNYTWATDFYEPLPNQENYLQIDNDAIYFDQPEFTEGEERYYFFYRTLDKGEELEYTLIFVVDEDLKDSLFLQFNAFPLKYIYNESKSIYFSLK